MPTLTDRQLAFAKHYAKTGRGAESAREAGYANAAQRAYHLLRRPHVAAEIERQRSGACEFADELTTTRRLFQEMEASLALLTRAAA